MPERDEAAPSFREIEHKARKAADAEIDANPRARSAKLRAAERTAAPALPLDIAALGLRAVPALDRLSPAGGAA